MTTSESPSTGTVSGNEREEIRGGSAVAAAPMMLMNSVSGEVIVACCCQLDALVT
jgi:hypothetical protein